MQITKKAAWRACCAVCIFIIVIKHNQRPPLGWCTKPDYNFPFHKTVCVEFLRRCPCANLINYEASSFFIVVSSSEQSDYKKSIIRRYRYAVETYASSL
jgi:hypothetical protein